MKKRIAIDRGHERIDESKPPSSMSELEGRLRPGASSHKGFLGQTESLEAVLAQDERTLQELGLTHAQIADALEDVLQNALDQREVLWKRSPSAAMKRDEWDWRRLLHQPAQHLSIDNLPSLDEGYLVRDKLQVFIVQYRGFQECPWFCEAIRWGSFDFVILNRQLGQHLAGPGLIAHLIRAHRFFEGLESPYRVDPHRVAQVLELAGGQEEQAPPPGGTCLP